MQQPEDAMLRSISFILTIALLSGCSEMQVIGNAAMRELRADAISVESISYNYNRKLAAREGVTGVMMAKAETGVQDTDGRTAGSEKKLKTAKVKKVKGLWEKH